MRKVWLEIKAEQSFMIITSPVEDTDVKLPVKM